MIEVKQMATENVQHYLNRLTEGARDLAGAYSRRELITILQRVLATELCLLMRKCRSKFGGPNVLQDFADHARALAESHRALKDTTRSSIRISAPVAARRQSKKKGAPSRSAYGSRVRRVRAVEGQDVGNNRTR